MSNQKPQTIMTDISDEHIDSLKEYLDLCKQRSKIKEKIDVLKPVLFALAAENDHNYIFGDIRLRKNPKEKLSIVKSGFDKLSPEIMKILWNTEAITTYTYDELTVNIVKRK